MPLTGSSRLDPRSPSHTVVMQKLGVGGVSPSGTGLLTSWWACVDSVSLGAEQEGEVPVLRTLGCHFLRAVMASVLQTFLWDTAGLV